MGVSKEPSGRYLCDVPDMPSRHCCATQAGQVAETAPCLNLFMFDTTITVVLLERLSRVYKRMFHAAMRAGRSPDEVRLVAVTKTVGTHVIREAIEAGVRLLGESRVQEASKKIASEELQLSGANLEWHFIGHLQRNKARSAVKLFTVIHTLDSIPLAEELEARAAEAGKTQRVLVQVNISEETVKHGIARARIEPLIEKTVALPHLSLEGLMGMPPYFEKPEYARPYFARLRDMKEELAQRGFPLAELSMGMSHDFEVAIEEGATLVRIGTALFGERSE